MKDSLLEIKAIFVAIFATVNAAMGTLAIPVYTLILMNVLDYATGLIAAKHRNETITSYTGFMGIAKKVCMLLLVIVGVVVDWLIIYAGEATGIAISVDFLVSSMVAIWLIANEIISLLENLTDIGVPLPSFLVSIVEKIQASADVDVDEE